MMRARLEIDYPGDTQVQVFSGRNKNPHFIIVGAEVHELDKNKINDYLNGCDWTDRRAKAYITPSLRCDDFMKD